MKVRRQPHAAVIARPRSKLLPTCRTRSRSGLLLLFSDRSIGDLLMSMRYVGNLQIRFSQAHVHVHVSSHVEEQKAEETVGGRRRASSLKVRSDTRMHCTSGKINNDAKPFTHLSSRLDRRAIRYDSIEVLYYTVHVPIDVPIVLK